MITADKFVPRTTEVEAMQLPDRDPMVAAKDHEEKVRAMAAWLDSKDIDIELAQHGVSIHILLEGMVYPGCWVTWEENGAMEILSDHEFQEKYTIKEASGE